MKKQYYIITLLFALLVGMTTSCEDRLNIPKHGNMGSMDDYYQTDSEVESALHPCISLGVAHIIIGGL